MAKALYGYLGANDSRLRWENDRLRARVAELEAEVARLSSVLADTAAAMPPVPLDDADIDPLILRPALA